MRLDSSTTQASDSRPHADYPAFLGYPQLGARHAVGFLLPRFLWIPKGWGGSTLDPFIHLTVQDLQVDLRLILPGFECASKFTRFFSEPQCHGSQVPLAWCRGSWLGRAVVPVIGALFQCRGWLPIVEAPGYSRRPTSTLVMQLLNIGNDTLSFETF